MARERQSMRKIKEMLRLNEAGFNKTQIEQLSGTTRKTVREYLRQAEHVGLRYSDIEKLSSKEIYAKLFPVTTERQHAIKDQPEWNDIHKELQKKHVTLALLWEEFIASNPNGCRYTQFCYHYDQWRKKLDLSMRQVHKLGEKCFVDYAGHTIPIINKETGEIRKAQIFVAVLGASNYTFAEATWTQSLPDWLSSHMNAFEYFGGVPELVIPDNLKSGVDKACRYEPDINKTYHDFALHYNVAIMPTRIRKPKDKPKVENAVLVVERWILAALRNRTFFNLTELNEAIDNLLEKLNTKPFKKLSGSRQSVFTEQEKSTLKPLPIIRYEYAQWKKAIVNIDYHVELEGHYYSVPYRYVKESIEIRYSAMIVTIFKDNKQLCSHLRSYLKGKHTTIKEHMPKSHQEYIEWTPSRIVSWASSIGEYTGTLVYRIINSKDHFALGYRSALGVIRLGNRYGNNRLEAAAQRAIVCGGYSYHSVKSILEKGLDQQPLPESQSNALPCDHENIRGAQYFNQTRKDIAICL